MSSSVCVALLCLVIIASTECNVIRTQEYPLPPEGLSVDILLKDNVDPAHLVTSMKVNIDEKQKKVTVTNFGDIPLMPAAVGKKDVPVATLEDRNGIRVGSCPAGYISRSGFCVLDD